MFGVSTLQECLRDVSYMFAVFFVVVTHGCVCVEFGETVTCRVLFGRASLMMRFSSENVDDKVQCVV